MGNKISRRKFLKQTVAEEMEKGAVGFPTPPVQRCFLHDCLLSSSLIQGDWISTKQKKGKIKTGYFADIAVLDLKLLTDNATYKAPHQYCEGVEHLFVNGSQSIENGKATGKRNGKNLRRA